MSSIQGQTMGTGPIKILSSRTSFSFFELAAKYTFCPRLVGPTASGKSSVGFPCYFSSFCCHFNTRHPKFVEKAAGIEGLSRGGLGSSTKEISVFKFPFPGLVDSRICLVDTPGVDSEERNIFDMIYVWFKKMYVQELLIFVEPHY